MDEVGHGLAGAAAPRPWAERSPGRGHAFAASILREYDIRGTVGRTLSAVDAYHAGRAFGTILARRSGRRVVVGYDGRPSSPELAGALVEGLAACGLDITEIGLAASPTVYFAASELAADAAVVVTGSHNPPAYNGIKLVLGGAPFFGEDIKGLGRLAAIGDYVGGSGRRERREMLEPYVERLVADAPSALDLTVAWDPGNGAAGPATAALVRRLPGRHVVINEIVDGRFPAHHPDPARPENLDQLIRTVARRQCDLGIAFDGDGDRIGVVDRAGRVVDGDRLLMLFAAELLADRPGAVVVSDVKASQAVFDAVTAAGGRPAVSPTGHSPIKARMKETAALLAGDITGHFFFADRYGGWDDGPYAAVRLLGLLARSGRDLAALVDELPSPVASPEVRIACPDSRKLEIVAEVARRLRAAGTEVLDVDGVRVSTRSGWWLVRASNTEAAITVRCEGNDALGHAEARQALIAALRAVGIKPEAAAL